MYVKDKPSRKVVFNQRDRKVDLRVSVCTECKAGIFKNQEYCWTRRGLVHKGCRTKDEITSES